LDEHNTFENGESETGKKESIIRESISIEKPKHIAATRSLERSELETAVTPTAVLEILGSKRKNLTTDSSDEERYSINPDFDSDSTQLCHLAPDHTFCPIRDS
jgi:hypothetical protein